MLVRATRPNLARCLSARKILSSKVCPENCNTILPHELVKQKEFVCCDVKEWETPWNDVVVTPGAVHLLASRCVHLRYDCT